MKTIFTKVISPSIKIATLTTVFMASNVCANAQDVKPYDVQKNEISISYGYNPTNKNLFHNTDSWCGDCGVNDDCIGVINLDYTRHVTKMLGIGINVSYSKNNKTYGYLVLGNGEREALTSQSKEHNWTFMPTLKFNWFRRDCISLYSRISAGITFKNEDGETTYSDNTVGPLTDSSRIFNFQASPIGIEAGNVQYRAFAELGIGQAGVIQAGLRYRF